MNKTGIILCTLALACQACTTTETRMREYISSSWERTIRVNTQDDSTLIGLPKPYTVPSPEGMFQEMYYWDTYFTNKGLIADGKVELAKGNTENILYMVDRFGFMPNGSRTWYLNRSQPPFLSIMVADVFKATQDKEWLAQAWPTLEKEYTYWQEKHSTPVGLTRYSGGDAPQWLLDEFVITGGQRLGTDFLTEDLTQEEHDRIGRNLTAEAESGWDFNPRFDRRCEDFCPVDLNSLMYAFEKNMSIFAVTLEKGDSIAQQWEALAQSRKERMMEYCFDKEKKSYTVREYKALVKSYRAARALYNERYAGSIETIEMVRAKLERLDEEAEKFCKEHPEQYLPDVPEMEDAPDESWEEFRKRFEEFGEQLKAWNEAFAKSSEINLYNANRLKVRLEEMNKFPQLEYELEMRLRHTYIDPKTGEHQYRPDDDVGEGLICVGSRDHNPVLKDE